MTRHRIEIYFTKGAFKYAGPALPVFILFWIYVFHFLFHYFYKYIKMVPIKKSKFMTKLSNFMNIEDIDIVEDLDDYPHSLRNNDIDWTIKEAKYFEENYDLKLKT